MRGNHAVATGIENALDVLRSRFWDSNHGEAAASHRLDRPLRILDGQTSVLQIDEQPIETGESEHLGNFRRSCGEQRSNEGLRLLKSVFKRGGHVHSLLFRTSMVNRSTAVASFPFTMYHPPT